MVILWQQVSYVACNDQPPSSRDGLLRHDTDSSGIGFPPTHDGNDITMATPFRDEFDEEWEDAVFPNNGETG